MKNELLILGISSATNTIGAAVINENSVIAESCVTGATARSEKLIPLIDEVLVRAGKCIKDIDAVAVTIGPGSYSGLRGGLAVAKGLVAALNIPILSVPTLEASAQNFRNYYGTFAVALHACKDEFNMALFTSNGRVFRRLTDDMTVKEEKMLSVLSDVEGPIMLACDRQVNISKENVIVTLLDAAVPWAKSVAQLGIVLMGKKKNDPIKLVPVYSHKPNIREYKK